MPPRSTSRVRAAIVGSGNIATDLAVKLSRSEIIEPTWMVGIDPNSEGLKRAGALGMLTTADGIDWLFDQPERPDIVFEATSASVHRANAPRYAEAGIPAVDLTPAAIGPYVVPTVNLDEHLAAPNVNLITCGGQATIPMVHAVARVVPVPYAEIVASVSSRSAGPGTRANIDEFTKTTARAIETVGGAARGKAIMVLNPADPPVMMRNTVFCALPDGTDTQAVADSIQEMARAVAAYVPGYRLRAEAQFDPASKATNGWGRVAVLLDVEGAGDTFPPYAGNLDIMTAAATRVGERIAETFSGDTPAPPGMEVLV
jgi:acetaldehyde dehydrogenase